MKIDRQAGRSDLSLFPNGTRRSRRPQCGISLVELLVACGITSIVLTAVLSVISMGLRRWNVQASQSLAMQQANTAVTRMGRDIHSAVSFSALSVGGNPVYNFTLPGAVDSSGNYIPQRSGATVSYTAGMQVRYYLSDTTGAQSVSGGTALWRAYLPAGQVIWQLDTTWSLIRAGKPFCGNVSALTISSASVDTVQISLTIQDTEGKVTSANTTARQVYLSNHN